MKQLDIENEAYDKLESLIIEIDLRGSMYFDANKTWADFMSWIKDTVLKVEALDQLQSKMIFI